MSERSGAIDERAARRAFERAARSYAERFEFDRMDRTLEALVARAPDHPGVHHYVAETHGLLRLPDRALASFERSLRGYFHLFS